MAQKTKFCRKCRIRKPLESFGNLARGKRRNVCYRCRDGKDPLVETPRFFKPLDSKRYIVTAAQNNTLVDSAFFQCLQVAAKHLEAELVVIPYRYKNPTGLQPGKDLRECGRKLVNPSMTGETICRRYVKHDGDCFHLPDPPHELWWDPEVEPYLHNVRKKLNENLVLAADIKTQATASTPLTGFESVGGGESVIIGHPKMQLKTIPVPTGKFPKILTTSGACTQRNYSNTKAGALGEFHHFLGALVVEIQGKTFHLRQVNADRVDGSFIDLDKLYTVDGVKDAPPALGLVMGDTHVRVTSDAVTEATFGSGGIVETLNPQTLVFHDIFDGETVNPHESDDPFLAAAKHKAKRTDVKSELQEVVDFVNTNAGGREVVIVSSNHHDFLRRWMVKTDWRRDQKNADFYLETALYMRQSAKMTAGGGKYADPFHYWIEKLGAKSDVTCLELDESFKIAGIECGMHGHHGPSGAKGSVKNLSRLGVKVISGHGHSPAIEEGHYRVGSSTPRQSYQHGPDASLNTHSVIYANGKRALINIIGGAWRLR